VTGHSGLRATGYFHLIASFSVFNIVYFVIKLLYLALTTLTSDFINLEFLADWLNDNGWLKRFFSDLVIATVGLQILLLSVMTIEHRFNLSRHFTFKPRGQTCMRVTMTLIIFALVIVCTVLAFLIRNMTLDFDITDQSSVLIIYAIYLMVYTCLPIFILVIVGVINCVSAWNSNRYHPIEIRLAQKLDTRFGFIGFLLILATVVYLILEMAPQIKAYESEAKILQLSIYGLSRIIDIILIIIPLTTTCVLGKRCCCWCCCKSCQPPLDE